MSEEEMEDVYFLTPEAAEHLANDPEGFRRDLALIYGDADAADEHFLMLRFIQGRERAEKEPPSAEEVACLVTHWRLWNVQSTLYSMAFRGLARPDVQLDEETGQLEVAWGLTTEGRDALENDPRYDEFRGSDSV